MEPITNKKIYQMIYELIPEDSMQARLARLKDGQTLHEHESNIPTSIVPDEPAVVELAVVGLVEAPADTKDYIYIKPAGDYLTSWLEWTLDPREHFKLGLEELDIKFRGFRPGELTLIQGYAQGGKGQVLLSSVLANRKRPYVWFTFDEPGEMVIAKAIGMLTGASTEDLEQGIRRGDKTVLRKLQAVAAEELPHFYIIDRPLGTGAMGDTLKEAEDRSQQSLAAFSIDYLGIISTFKGEREDDKAKELKAWVQELEYPCFCVHQNSRSGGSPGEPVTLTSGRMGGEQEATHIITVRRKRDWKELSDHERHGHRNTVSVGASKNKRNGWTGEFDYYMNPLNGLVLPRDHDPDYVHMVEQMVDPRPVRKSIDQLLEEAKAKAA